MTGVEDGAAWQRLARRMATGDLQTWARHLDGLQHESHGRILTALEWSPTIGPLADVPIEPSEHEPTMFMEDTMWPFPGKVHEYIEAAGTVYRRALGAEGSQVQMSIELALQALPGAGRYPEVTLLQRALEPPAADPAADQRHPGRGHRARIVDARGTRAPGPVAEQAPPNRGMVAAPMTPGAPSGDPTGGREVSTVAVHA